MTAHQSQFTPVEIPDGIVELAGKKYMTDAKGALVPVELIKPQHALEDQLVRSVMGFALSLSAQLARFRGHTVADLGAFDATLLEKYGVTKGGARGNKTYRTYDGLFEVEVRVQDQIEFGPELQVAKSLVDECLNEWSEGSRPEIRGIITRAFNTDKEGKINRSEIFMLMRLEIEDERWQNAMQAIKDAIRVTGSKSYIRFRMKSATDAPLVNVSIDLANA